MVISVKETLCNSEGSSTEEVACQVVEMGQYFSLRKHRKARPQQLQIQLEMLLVHNLCKSSFCQEGDICQEYSSNTYPTHRGTGCITQGVMF